VNDKDTPCEICGYLDNQDHTVCFEVRCLRDNIDHLKSRVRELEAHIETLVTDKDAIAVEFNAARWKIKDLESELEHCRAMYLRDADTGEYYTVDDMLTVKAELAQKKVDLKLALDLLASERTRD
jgi:outer membrane murein-binding lipoprotein Lpp